MTRIGLLALLTLPACAPALYSTRALYATRGRAAPNALDCSLQLGLSQNYQPTAGGTNAGFIRLEKFWGQVLTVAVTADTLHLEAKMVVADGGVSRASSETRNLADEILRRCGAPLATQHVSVTRE